MTSKLKTLIDATANEVIDKSEDCLFRSSRVKMVAGILATFADKIVQEVAPDQTTPPA